MVIDKSHVAILYETITGQCQKRGTISVDGSETFDIDAFVARHPGLGAVIVPRADLPGLHAVNRRLRAITANEHFFRLAVAAQMNTPYFEFGADRAVMVHGTSRRAVSVHHGNVPGLDNPDPGHSLISHLSADVGDMHDGARDFLREYAVIHSQTGEVVRMVFAPVDEPVATMPASPLLQHHVRVAAWLTVGDRVPSRPSK